MRFVAVMCIFLCLLFGACGKPSAQVKTPEAKPAETIASSTAQVEQIDPTAGLDKGDPEIGREYFYGENRGRCLACHILNGQGEPGGFALDDAGLRHDPRWLAIFVSNPRAYRPEVARMSPFRGDPVAKIADVVAFLMTLKTPVEHPAHTDVKPPDEPEKHEGGLGSGPSGD